MFIADAAMTVIVNKTAERTIFVCLSNIEHVVGNKKLFSAQQFLPIQLTKNVREKKLGGIRQATK
jgi:hypothetical protein